MKISKDKRNKLIGVAAGTVVVIAVMWVMLINSQLASLKEVETKIDTTKSQEEKMQTSVKYASKIQSDVDAADADLTQVGAGMASGDLYSWMYNTIKDFKTSYHVEIPQFSAVEQSECNLIYKFPFKQVRMTVSGTGYFHDIGKFVAEFENHFHQMRIQNLELSPSMASAGPADRDREREKLSFRMDIYALVKTADMK